MKKILIPFLVLILSAGITFFSVQSLIKDFQQKNQPIIFNDEPLTINPVGARTVLSIQQGGATSTIPGNNMILMGTSTINASTTYNLVRIPDCAGANETLNFASSSQTFSCGDDTGASFAWTPGGEGNSTSTRLLFGNGFISSASSTVASTFQVTGHLAASSTLSADRLMLTSTSATSTFANGLQLIGGSLRTLLTGCNGSSVLETDSLGNLQCGTDSEGSAVFPFTPSVEGNATSTRILLNSGFISSASSTISNTLSVSTLSSGLIGSGNGLLYGGIATGTVSGTGGITVTASRSAIGGALAIDCTAAGSGSTGCLSSTDWTTFNNKAGFAYLFPSNATTSSLTIGGILSTASSTFSSNLDLSGGTVKQILPSSFSYATSSSWTSSTTRQLGTANVAETWNYAICYTTVGTLNINFSDGTNLMNMISASATPARFALTTNNSFTKDEKRQVAIGTPASSPVEISCTIEKIVN